MPRRFFGIEPGASPDVFVPFAMYDQLLSTSQPRLAMPNSFWLAAMARLAPGIDAATAGAEMNVAYHQGNAQA
jgi:hypothetical protein